MHAVSDAAPPPPGPSTVTVTKTVAGVSSAHSSSPTGARSSRVGSDTKGSSGERFDGAGAGGWRDSTWRMASAGLGDVSDAAAREDEVRRAASAILKTWLLEEWEHQIRDKGNPKSMSLTYLRMVDKQWAAMLCDEASAEWCLFHSVPLVLRLWLSVGMRVNESGSEGEQESGQEARHRGLAARVTTSRAPRWAWPCGVASRHPGMAVRRTAEPGLSPSGDQIKGGDSLLVKGRRSYARILQRALHGRSASTPTRTLSSVRSRGFECSSQSVLPVHTLSSAMTVCSMLQFR